MTLISSDAQVFVSTNIAETSLTFPRLKYVIDSGKVQRPRWRRIDGTPLPGALMETLPASDATLKQRLGRVGRTMPGHYLALYTHASLANRDKHIAPKMSLQLHQDIIFGLQLQLKQAVDLDFPSEKLKLRLETLPEEYYRIPNLGSSNMAHAFYYAQSPQFGLRCGRDIIMLAALKMKFPTAALQNLARSAF